MKAYLSDGTTIERVENISGEDGGIMLFSDATRNAEHLLGYIPHNTLHAVVPDNVDVNLNKR